MIPAPPSRHRLPMRAHNNRYISRKEPVMQEENYFFSNQFHFYLKQYIIITTVSRNGGLNMTGMMDNEHGQIMIDTSVIEEYAGHAALDCFGIVGMAAISMRDGLAKLLKGSSVSKGVTVDMDEEQRLTIDFHIIVAYGVSIRTVVSNLINTVKYQVEDYTNMKVKAINVYVEGVREID